MIYISFWNLWPLGNSIKELSVLAIKDGGMLHLNAYCTMHMVPKTVSALSHLIFTVTLEVKQHYYLHFVGRKTDMQIIGIKIGSLEPILSNTTIVSHK